MKFLVFIDFRIRMLFNYEEIIKCFTHMNMLSKHLLGNTTIHVLEQSLFTFTVCQNFVIKLYHNILFSNFPLYVKLIFFHTSAFSFLSLQCMLLYCIIRPMYCNGSLLNLLRSFVQFKNFNIHIFFNLYRFAFLCAIWLHGRVRTTGKSNEI